MATHCDRQQCRRIAVLGCAACCLLPAVCCRAADSPKLFGEVPRTAQRFEEAAALEKQQHWAAAIDLYLRLAEEAGDDLVPADRDAHHLLTARKLVHRRIAARPELLAPYRVRVEPAAKRLLEQGQSNRDSRLLEQVVDQFFCSRSAETALHLLGDLACERGEFERARGYWQMLGPPTSPWGLAYPGPLGGPALATAKCILARLLAGERAEAAAELQAFRSTHPDAAGHLAGRDGNLAVTLQSLLDTADTVRVPASIGVAPPPTSYAGDATRNDVLHGVLPPFCPQPRYGPIPLPGATPERRIQRSPIRPSALAFYPLIAHGQVFVADARQVLAYNVATGQLSAQYCQPGDVLGADDKLPLQDGGGFSLTIDGDFIYARLGPARMHLGPESATALVCLQWQPEGKVGERLRAKWTLPAAKADANAVAVWEGTPVVWEGGLFAALTRFDGNRAVSSIACYPAADPSAGPLWQKDVYEAVETGDRTRPHLLTLAGPNVVLSSEAGVVVAVEAATGRRAWAFRYPTSERNGPCDPNPCVFAHGRLFIAPADADRVWCLDAATGAPLWSSTPVQVAHLLGVVQGRVICTLGGFHAGLCALDAATGRRIPDWGYRVAGAEALGPFGRGLLCGDRVYWPTRAAGVQELRWDGRTGYPPTCFRDLPGGNLAYGDGCLVLATADRLHVLVGESAAVAGPDHRLGRRSSAERHELLLWHADLLSKAGRPATEVRADFDAAAAAEFSPERRLLALVRRAEDEEANGGPHSPPGNSKELESVVIRDANGAIRSEKVSGTISPAPTPARPEMVPDTFFLPLAPAWSLPLDAGHEWTLLPQHDSEPSRAFVAGPDWLSCRDTADGTERWRTALSFNPIWLTAVNGSLLVAGDNGVARLSGADGQPAWQFPVPQIAPWFDRPGWQDADAIAPCERLSGFQFAGGRLVARLGSRLLIALDGVTGQLAWQRSAPFAREYFPAYLADDHCVVAQSSDGRLWAFDMADGHTLHTGPAPTDPWPTPPIALPGGRVLVVEDGRLVALDRSIWKPAWTWDLPRPISLGGALPQTQLVNGELLVGVPRNDCYEIERLNPRTGRPLSNSGVAIDRDAVEFDALAFDGDRFLIATRGELKAIDCRTGAVEFRRSLRKFLPKPEIPGVAPKMHVQAVANGLVMWTLPGKAAGDVPEPGAVVLWDRSEPERQRGAFSSLALGLGPGNVLRAVRIDGNNLVITTDTEIRAYRGTNREAK